MEISPGVLRVLRFEGISEAELARMLSDAVPLTKHPIRGFNRRYFHWLFKVVGERLEGDAVRRNNRSRARQYPNDRGTRQLSRTRVSGLRVDRGNRAPDFH